MTAPQHLKDSLAVKVFLCLLILAPILIHLYYVCLYAVNIPLMDDYDAVLGFLNDFKKSGTAHRVVLLFSQHNEHRILSSNLFYAAYYLVTGTINFKQVIMVNFGQLLLIFGICTWFMRRALPQYWLFAAAVLSACLFDINNFENASFAMAGMQNYGIVLLMLSSLLFYSFSSKGSFVAAVLLQIICIYSSGNGMVAAFFILLFNLLSKDKARTYVSGAVLLVGAPLYYYHYTRLQTGFFTLVPAKVSTFFFHIMGAHFSYDWGILAGILLLVALLLALPVRRLRSVGAPVAAVLCIVGFLLASMGIMSFFRGNMDPHMAYSSRYFIYPHLLVAFTFVLVCIRLPRPAIIYGFIAFTMLGLSVSYISNYRDGKAGFISFNNSLTTQPYFYPDSARAKTITDESCRLHIYCIEEHRTPTAK